MSLLEPFGKIFLKRVRRGADSLGFLWVDGRIFFHRLTPGPAPAAKSLHGVTLQVFRFIRHLPLRRSAVENPNFARTGSKNAFAPSARRRLVARGATRLAGRARNP